MATYKYVAKKQQDGRSTGGCGCHLFVCCAALEKRLSLLPFLD
jgi:hypothetical protein